MYRARVVLASLLCLVLLGGCYDEPVAITTPSPTPEFLLTAEPMDPTATPAPPTPATATLDPTPEPTPVELPTPTAVATPIDLPTPTAASGGPPTVGCRDGWNSPQATSDEYTEALAILDNHMGVSGPWTIVEMRYFTGPDAPGIIEPRYDPVHRWYVKASRTDEPTFAGRWLLEKRTDTVLGISAVAPYETVGYQSPDWTGFVGEGAPQTYIGLPGQWSGIPYDFVTGEGDSGNAGLPPEVLDCLVGV